MKKRILSIILALCMVFCLVPTTALAATQTAGSWSELQTLINQTNNLSVTLSSDISWGGSSLTVPTGKTVTLDLNGKAIDAKSNGTVLVVNGTLTIKNSGADLAGPIGVGAGPITGNIKNGKASDQEAGGILVAGGGKLVMNSGWLTNCVDGSSKISAAGGIYVSKNAVFEMTGGIITGCVGSDLLCAAGVVNYGTFTMSGNATISGSKTGYNSDGVAICNAGILDANGGTVQTGQKCVNYATVQNTEKSATVFYCNVLNTGLGTIKGGLYNYPVTNAGIITGGTFNGTVTSNGTINDGIFKGTVDNAGVVTGGTFNGTTTGIYTVTFNSGVPSQIRANCPATLPDSPTKRGYIFNGWLNGGTPYDFTQNVTQNIHLTADWTPKSYTVKFDTNGGTAIADKTLTWDDKVLDGVSDPEKPGYDFAGWTFDGGNVLTRTTYANLAADDTVTSITLTAQWTLHLYTVTLDANGGTFDASGSTVAQDTMQVTYGGNFEQMPIPRYKGYFFRGWYDEQWGGRQYGDEDGRGTYTYDKTEDCTLYALWEEAPLCTVTFNPNGGTLTGAETCQEKQNERIQRPYEEPIREGYYFRGWYKDADCTQMWDFDDPIPGNMTLYAGWDILSYVIRVRLENGEQDIIINQNYGTPVTVPDDPTREGYTFIGWDIPFPAKMPAKITTITAQWTINQYTITFDTAEMTVTVNDGHTFGEWTSNGDGTHTRQCTADGCTEGVETDNCTDEDKNHICDICGNIISNHEDANQDHVCDLCGKVISNHEDADNNHICDYCDKVISNHEDADEDHVCDFCGKTISNHADTNNNHVCDYCGKTISNHEDADKDHVCDLCGKVITNHAGGKETCRDKAVCEVCGKAYGELDPKNHTDLKHFPAKAATEDAEGNVEYWHCDDCNKYYSDKDGTKEFAKADTVTAKLPKAPPTGDTSNLMLWIALLLISGGALIGTTVTEKKKKQK